MTEKRPGPFKPSANHGDRAPSAMENPRQDPAKAGKGMTEREGNPKHQGAAHQLAEPIGAKTRKRRVDVKDSEKSISRGLPLMRDLEEQPDLPRSVQDLLANRRGIPSLLVMMSPWIQASISGLRKIGHDTLADQWDRCFRDLPRTYRLLRGDLTLSDIFSSERAPETLLEPPLLTSEELPVNAKDFQGILEACWQIARIIPFTYENLWEKLGPELSPSSDRADFLATLAFHFAVQVGQASSLHDMRPQEWLIEYAIKRIEGAYRGLDQQWEDYKKRWERGRTLAGTWRENNLKGTRKACVREVAEELGVTTRAVEKAIPDALPPSRPYRRRS